MKLNTSKLNSKVFTEISFTGILMIIFVVGAIWAGIQFGGAYFQDTKLESHLVAIILKNKAEPSDEILQKAIAEEIKTEDGVTVEPSAIQILRSSDAANISVKVSYKRPITIPILSKTWDIPFIAKAEVSLTNKMR